MGREVYMDAQTATLKALRTLARKIRCFRGKIQAELEVFEELPLPGA